MAELGSTPVSGYRDHVDGPRGGQNRDLSACAIRARDPPQQRASINPGKTGATSRAEPHQHPPGKFVASIESEDLDTQPFTAQERLI